MFNHKYVHRREIQAHNFRKSWKYNAEPDETLKKQANTSCSHRVHTLAALSKQKCLPCLKVACLLWLAVRCQLQQLLFIRMYLSFLLFQTPERYFKQVAHT